MKRLIIAYLAITISLPAWASVRRPKIHTTDAAAMGYADIAFSGPAAGALDQPGGGFRAISLDARGTLSEGLEIVDWVNDVKDFKESFVTVFDALASVDDLIDIGERSGWTLGARLRMDLLRFSFAGPKLGYLVVGGYIESSAGVRVPKPDTSTISWQGDHIDIGADYKALMARGWADGGIVIQYGRPIGLPKGMRLGVGIAHRVFHRMYVPEHAFVFRKELYSGDDIEIPDFTYERGWGFGTDFFASFDTGDRYVGGRLSVEVRNAPTISWMGEGTTRDMVMIGTGVSLHPLRWAGIDDWLVAADVETFEDGMPAVHTGTSWRLGNQRFHFTPLIGGALLGRDVWGDPYHSFTAGFSAKAAVLELAGVFEYRGNGRYDAGVRAAVGW